MPVADRYRRCHTDPVTRLTIIGLGVLLVSLAFGSVAGAIAVANDDELGGVIVGFFALMGILSGGMAMQSGTKAD